MRIYQQDPMAIMCVSISGQTVSGLSLQTSDTAQPVRLWPLRADWHSTQGLCITIHK